MEGVLPIRNEALRGGCGVERLDTSLEYPFSILLTGRDRSAREGKGKVE